MVDKEATLICFSGSKESGVCVDPAVKAWASVSGQGSEMADAAIWMKTVARQIFVVSGERSWSILAMAEMAHEAG